MSKRALMTPAGYQLRVAHVWRDEVMAHQVFPEPEPVTIGPSKKATFVLPSFGLPEDVFPILQPGKHGYELMLGIGMGGRISVGGTESDVADVVQSGAAADDLLGTFRAVSISPGDWGVVELDEQGDHVIYFQFVREEPALPSPPSLWGDSELLLPAVAFALILHAALLVVAFQFHEAGNSLVFPGRRDIMTSYIVNRPVELEEEKPAEEAASKDGDKENIRSATKGEKGKAGGEGETERARDPDPGDVPKEIQTGLLTQDSRRTIARVTQNQAIDDRLKRSLARLKGNTRPGSFGSGRGTGTGFGSDQGGTGTTRGGKGTGPGGGGSVEGDFVSQGKIDTGETRRPKGDGGSGRGVKEVAVVGTGSASGELGGLSAAEIDKVIKSRKGLIRACYQRELDRSRGLGGKLVVRFRISGAGSVSSPSVVSGQSTLKNSKVESCVLRQLTQLKFPAKGGSAIVNYPFIFSQG